MKKDYTMRPGKESQIANNRQRMGEAQHSSSDAFVKSQQAKVKKYAGKAPKMEEKYFHFNAEMMNNGEHAQRLADKLTGGLDKVAFPVKKA